MAVRLSALLTGRSLLPRIIIFLHLVLLQIRRPGFDSRHYQKENVVGLERGPLSLVSTTEKLLDNKSSGSCLGNREFGHRDPSR
jgi:hypothetical protein